MKHECVYTAVQRMEINHSSSVSVKAIRTCFYSSQHFGQIFKSSGEGLNIRILDYSAKKSFGIMLPPTSNASTCTVYVFNWSIFLYYLPNMAKFVVRDVTSCHTCHSILAVKASSETVAVRRIEPGEKCHCVSSTYMYVDVHVDVHTCTCILHFIIFIE